jgi:DNA invertase Pin-like site-specific DNA recombinase
MPFRKKRAAIYARYSSQHQTELSVEGQTERILEYCKKNGFEIVKEYADRGISAFLIEKRLDFQKLIQDAMEAKVVESLLTRYVFIRSGRKSGNLGYPVRAKQNLPEGRLGRF